MSIKKFVTNRWAVGLFTATVITSGSLGIASIANNQEPAPIVDSVDETDPVVDDGTTDPVTEPEPQPEPQPEKITFEYYTITEEAAKNSWSCKTIDRCDKEHAMVYIYDPAVLGKHKFNIVTGFEFLQADITFVFVDEYNNILGTKTYTMDSATHLMGFTITVTDYPPGTKYVKFADLNNYIYP